MTALCPVIAHQLWKQGATLYLFISVLSILEKVQITEQERKQVQESI